MKRFLSFAIALFLFLPLFETSAFAFSESQQSLADQAGVGDIQGEYIEEAEVNGEKNINIFQKALQILGDFFTENGTGVFKSFGAILSCLVLCCLLGAMKFGESQALDSACGYASALALAGVSYSVLYNLFVFVIAAMESLSAVMGSLLPVMGSLYVFGGNAATGAASASGFSLFLSLLSVVCTKVLLPLLRLGFVFALAGALPEGANLSSVNNLVRNTATTLMAFLFTLLGFALYLQTSIAAASDSFAARSVKFAGGVFVPVIGGILGDAARSVAASVAVIKGSVGGAGVVLVLSAVLPPVLAVLLYKLVFLCCSAAAKALGCENEARLLQDLSGLLGVLLALVIGAGVVCIIGLAVFINR